MTKKQLDALRNVFADYIRSEGCSCCQNTELHDEAAARLGELLEVPKFDDGSGYNFWQFASKR